MSVKARGTYGIGGFDGSGLLFTTFNDGTYLFTGLSGSGSNSHGLTGGAAIESCQRYAHITGSNGIYPCVADW
jgi:hypothetical protein